MQQTNQNIITQNRLIDMRLKIDDFEQSMLKDLNKLYTSLVKEMVGTLKKTNPSALWTRTRQLALTEEFAIANKVLTKAITTPTAEALSTVGLFSYDSLNNIVGWDGKVSGFNSVSVSRDQLRNLITDQKLKGKNLSEWIGSTLKPNIEGVKSEIQKGFLKGASYQKTISAINKAYGDGSSRRDIESIVKTYTQAINVSAQEDVYKANSDIVKKVEWSAILESGNTKTGRGTCPRCAALDGMQWGVNQKNRPPCPLHIRCRCILQPITKTWRELGLDVDEMEETYKPWLIRDKKGNLLEHGTTGDSYGQWWKTKGETFQNNVVGVTRANLIRDGFVDFGEIVDAKSGDLILLDDIYKIIGGNPYTVKQIRAKAKIPIKYDTTYQLATGYLKGVAPSILSKQQSQLILKDKDYDILNTTNGAYHSGGDIHLNKNLLGTAKEGTTFLHEYGHRLDYVHGPVLASKYGDLAPGMHANYFSANNDYRKALTKDSKALSKIDRDSFKALGGTGRYNKTNFNALKREKTVQANIELNAAVLAIKNKKPILENAVDHMNKLEIDKAYSAYEGLTDFLYKEILSIANKLDEPQKSLKRGRAYEFLISSRMALVMASKTGAKSYIIDDWLYSLKATTGTNQSTRIGLYIADAIGGTTNNKYGYGHSVSYYRDAKFRTGSEAFANIFALSGHKDASGVLNDLLPNQVGVFKKFLKDVL